MIRRILVFVAKLSFSIALTVGLLELGLRLLGVSPVGSSAKLDLEAVPRLPVDEAVTVAFQQRWINLPASTFTAVPDDQPPIQLKRNWCGCREDDETPLRKSPGSYRILVLGDSHTDGMVENRDSFANVLEAELGEAHDVVNCGKGPSSPYEQLCAYRYLYRRFEHDLLVVAIYSGNDFLDLMVQDDRSHLQKIGDEFVHAQATARPDLVFGSASPWMRHSAVAQALTRLGLLDAQARRIRARHGQEYFQLLEEAKNQFPAATWQGLNQSYYFKHYPHDWALATEMLQHVLSEFRRLAPVDGLVVVSIPTYRQLRPEVVLPAAEILQLNEDDLNADERACQVVTRLCDELEIPLLDIRSALRTQRERVFWEFDHHLNVAGHRTIALELREMLQQNGRTNTPRRGPELQSF